MQRLLLLFCPQSHMNCRVTRRLTTYDFPLPSHLVAPNSLITAIDITMSKSSGATGRQRTMILEEEQSERKKASQVASLLFIPLVSLQLGILSCKLHNHLTVKFSPQSVLQQPQSSKAHIPFTIPCGFNFLTLRRKFP